MKVRPTWLLVSKFLRLVVLKPSGTSSPLHLHPSLTYTLLALKFLLSKRPDHSQFSLFSVLFAGPMYIVSYMLGVKWVFCVWAWKPNHIYASVCWGRMGFKFQITSWE